MISFIKGTVEIKQENSIVIENSGIGYLINVPSNSLFYQKNSGETVKIFTVMIVKEDDMSLFGFESSDEVELFNKLISVNGVGAKAAMSIFSAMSAMEIKKAIYTEDSKALTKANGIGKKTAQRIVIDLKDKVGEISVDIDDIKNVDKSSITLNKRIKDDVISALEELGYSKSEAVAAVDKVKGKDLELEEYIKLALKQVL